MPTQKAQLNPQPAGMHRLRGGISRQPLELPNLTGSLLSLEIEMLTPNSQRFLVSVRAAPAYNHCPFIYNSCVLTWFRFWMWASFRFRTQTSGVYTDPELHTLPFVSSPPICPYLWSDLSSPSPIHIATQRSSSGWKSESLKCRWKRSLLTMNPSPVIQGMNFSPWRNCILTATSRKQRMLPLISIMSSQPMSRSRDQTAKNF